MFPITDETQTLKAYLKRIAQERADDRVSYDEIESDTGVRMDKRGRDALRRAAKYVGAEYAPIPNYGILLAGPTNATQVVGGKMARIDSAARAAERASKNVINQFHDRLSHEDRQAIGLLSAMFGAIRLHTESYRRVARSRTIAANTAISGQ